MSGKKFSGLILIALIALVFALTGCNSNGAGGGGGGNTESGGSGGGGSGGGGGPAPTVSSVTVTPANTSVSKGQTFQFTAVVNGTNSPAQTVTWSVVGSSSSDIKPSGLLTVGSGESASELFVRATSTVNTSRVGTAAVTVSAAASGVAQYPVVADFTISNNLTQTVGSVALVTASAASGKSGGTVSVKYDGSSGLPTGRGKYTVTLDVTADPPNWYAATGIPVGTLTINDTPKPDHFTIGNLIQKVDNIKDVTVTPKTGNSKGEITIYYGGETSYLKKPQTKVITFDIAAYPEDNWAAATGMAGGTLVISMLEPVAGDFNISGLSQKADDIKQVTITPKEGKSQGAITKYYGANGTNLPSAAGTYNVTFNVAEYNDYWAAAASLAAGNLVITP
ncbi:MAG: hypothetical protein FWC19_08945 [Treponema sp.]|nr:hypothetical protein [Treponema sp.]MCL2272908.1 hypothetical protein [Treponema sp.]